MEGVDQYAGDMVLPFAGLFNHESLGFRTHSELNETNFEYTSTAADVLMSCRDVYWPRRAFDIAV